MAHLNTWAKKTIVAEHFADVMQRTNRLELITYKHNGGRGWNVNIGATGSEFNGAGERIALSHHQGELFVSCRRSTISYPSVYTGVKVFDMNAMPLGDFLPGRPVVDLAWRSNALGDSECTFQIPNHFTTNEWHLELGSSIYAPNVGYHFEVRKRNGDFVRYFGQHHLYAPGEPWDDRITQSYGGCWINDRYYAVVQTLRVISGLATRNHYWIFEFDAEGAFIEKYSLQDGVDTVGPSPTRSPWVAPRIKSGYLKTTVVDGVTTEEIPVIGTVRAPSGGIGFWTLGQSVQPTGYKHAKLTEFSPPYFISPLFPGGVSVAPAIFNTYTEQTGPNSHRTNAIIATPISGEWQRDTNNDNVPDAVIGEFSQIFFYSNARFDVPLRTNDGGYGLLRNGRFSSPVSTIDSSLPYIKDMCFVGDAIYCLGYGVTDWTTGARRAANFILKRTRLPLTQWTGYTDTTAPPIGAFPTADQLRPYVEPGYMGRNRIPRQHLTDIRAALMALLTPDGPDGCFMYFHPSILTANANPLLWGQKAIWQEFSNRHWYRYFAQFDSIPRIGGFTRKAFMDYWPITQDQLNANPELRENWAKDDDELTGTKCEDIDIGEVASLALYMEKSSQVFGP